MLLHFCMYTVDSQYPVRFPGHEASVGNMEGQSLCFHRVQRSGETYSCCPVFLQQVCKVQSYFCVWYGDYRALSCITESNFPLTRNPPLGLVTSVVPMVIFSLTSCTLGTDVFPKKKIWMNKQSETNTEQNGEAEQLDKFLFCIFPEEESRSPAFLTSV